MPSCQCDMTEEQGIRPGYCRFCSGTIDPGWVSSTTTFNRFFVHLAKLPDVPHGFIQEAHARMVAGQDEFGFEYLKRQNPTEAQEEASDGANYCLFTSLQDVRAGADRIDPDLLEAAHHFAQAWGALERRKHRG